MSSPNYFNIGQQVGTNFNESFAKTRDTNAIEGILSNAMRSGDPKVMQDSIGKILSQVSPERQGPAVQYLQNAYQNIQSRQQQAKTEQAEKEAGLIPGLPPAVQAAMYKENQKNRRIDAYGMGGQPNFGDQSQSVPFQNQPMSQQQADPQRQNTQSGGLRAISTDKLIQLTGAPDREISEPAKAELKRRDEDQKFVNKAEASRIKGHTDISNKILDENEKDAQNLIPLESALDLMKDATVQARGGFFTLDNLANMTGIEALRTPEGALFKTAGKEFFLGNLTRSGARPNQFIEMQIASMLPDIGRSKIANLSVERALKNELDIRLKKVDITRNLAESLEKKYGYVPRNIGELRDKELREYAQEKQDELNNDLRSLKAIDEGKPQKYVPVKEGTEISKTMVQALLNEFKNDPDKAREAAKKLGYSF